MESKRIENTLAELRQELGREPDEEHLAARLGWNVEELRGRMSKLAPVRVLSIDDLTGAGQVSSGGENPFDSVARQELLVRLQESITRLSKRQQQVLHLYYREELTLKEVGEVLGVTESRVCQIVSEISVRLRSMLTESELAEDDQGKGSSHG